MVTFEVSWTSRQVESAGATRSAVSTYVPGAVIEVQPVRAVPPDVVGTGGGAGSAGSGGSPVGGFVVGLVVVVVVVVVVDKVRTERLAERAETLPALSNAATLYVYV